MSWTDLIRPQSLLLRFHLAPTSAVVMRVDTGPHPHQVTETDGPPKSYPALIPLSLRDQKRLGALEAAQPESGSVSSLRPTLLADILPELWWQ